MAESKDFLDMASDFILPEAYAGMTYPAKNSKALESNVAQANALRNAGFPARHILKETGLYPGYGNEWEYVSDIDLGKYDYSLDPKYARQEKPKTMNAILQDSGLNVNRPEVMSWELHVSDPAAMPNKSFAGLTLPKQKQILLNNAHDKVHNIGHELGGHVSRLSTLEKEYPTKSAPFGSVESNFRTYSRSLSEINAEVQAAIARETDVNKIADALDAVWGRGTEYYPDDRKEAFNRAANALKNGHSFSKEDIDAARRFPLFRGERGDSVLMRIGKQ